MIHVLPIILTTQNYCFNIYKVIVFYSINKNIENKRLFVYPIQRLVTIETYVMRIEAT